MSKIRISKISSILVSLLVLMMVIAILPSHTITEVKAEEGEESEVTYVAQSADGKTKYTTYTDAWNAAKQGTSIVMLTDWVLDSTLDDDDLLKSTLSVGKNETVTIDMNGHKIDRNISSPVKMAYIIAVQEGGTLNLKSDVTTDISYNGYNANGETESKTIHTGGLLTGCIAEQWNISGSSTDPDEVWFKEGVGGIKMYQNSTVNLDNIAIAGNKVVTYNGHLGCGGAIRMRKNASLSMNSTIIQDNYVEGNGGAIHILGDGCSIYMNRSMITSNYAVQRGGAIYSYASDNFKLTMLNDSKIIENVAGSQGGGVYVYKEGDMNVYGTVFIYNNSRTDGSNDDVFLDTQLFFNDAWINGNPNSGSRIGIRCDGARKISDSLHNYEEGMFFLNTKKDQYRFEYSNKVLKVVSGESPKYSVTINGVEKGKYYSGDTVTIHDNNRDYEQVFLSWDPKSATGFSITNEQSEQSVFEVYMPSNDISINGKYLTRLTSLTLKMSEDTPKGNDWLPTSVQYTYGPDDTRRWTSEGVEWLEVDGDKYTPTSGRAKYNTSYALKFQLPQNIKDGVSFSNKIKDSLDNITIKFGDGITLHAASISLSEAGTLTVISEPITTDPKKVTVTSFEPDAFDVVAGIKNGDLIEYLPSFTVGLTADGNKDIYYVDRTKITDETIASLIDSDGTVVKPEGGSATITLPLIKPEGVEFAEGAVFNVTITVVDDIPLPTVATPTASKPSGSFSGTSLKVEASTTTEGAQICYKINGGIEQTYDSTRGIELTTAQNTASSFFVDVWAELGSSTSDTLHLWYILDGRDEKTVTINCSDTSFESWTDQVVQTYAAGTSVTLFAPTYAGREFEKWVYKNEEGTEVESTDAGLKLMVSEDITVQAIYNPVISAISINIPFPQAGATLATKENVNITATIGGKTDDITDHFDLEQFTWLPEDTTADYETSYTAKLPITHTDSIHYVLAENLLIMVNGDANPIYSVNVDKDYKNLYVTFPETAVKPDEPEPSFEPTDEPEPTATPTATPTVAPTSTPETKKSTATPTSGWDDGGPFTTDKCGNVYDRWGNKIYEATSCNVGGYNLVRTSVED